MVSYTLSLAGKPKVKLKLTHLSLEPTFVSRYGIVAELVSRLPANQPKVLDVGGHGGLLPELLPNQIDVIDIQDNDTNYPHYFKTSGLAMPFKDGEYEVVVSCDALEHIEKQSREKFLSEILRVSSRFVILCAPFKNPGVVAAEADMNQLFKKINGIGHRWLEEHIAYGVPEEASVEKHLKQPKYSFHKFRHIPVDFWRLIIEAQFAKESLNDPKLSKKINQLFTSYIQDISLKDFSNNGYRTFYLIDKSGADFKLELPKPASLVSSRLAFANGLATTLLLSGGEQASRLEEYSLKLPKLERQLKDEAQRRLRAENDLNTVTSSRGWQLIQKIRSLKDHVRSTPPANNPESKRGL